MKNLVWLASYPKSGSTWTRAFLACYASDARGPIPLKRINDITRSESRFELFCTLSKKTRQELSVRDIDSLRESVQTTLARNIVWPTLLKTHNARVRRNGFPLIRPELTRRAVYIVRNPMDIVDSLADHANLSLDESIALLNNRAHCLGGPSSVLVPQYLDSWTNHVESWLSTKGFPVHLVKYEKLKAAPFETFGKLIQFLEWDFDSERLERAVQWSDIRVLRSSEISEGFEEKSPVSKSPTFFRHGEVGRWPSLLSESQVGCVVTHHGETMRKLGYGTEKSEQISEKH